MSTLKIKKLQSGAFEHIDSIDGTFFLGRFNFKHEFNKAFLVEAYGAKRRTYGISDIEVYNYLGSAEPFTNWTDLINRLVDLSYTGIDTNSIPSGGGVWGGISGTLSNQTDLQNALNSKQDTLTSTNFGTFSNSLTTDDTIPDAGIFNYTNILGIQVKTTWANIKAKLASIFLTKVSTVDVEKVYIKNADGTQGMKPVSELLSEILITNASVTGTYNIDYSAGDVWDLTLTGNTTLTESNAPASGKTKTITLEVSGNFTLTYPAGWTTGITGAYSGTATLNTITIQTFGSKRKVLIAQPS